MRLLTAYNMHLPHTYVENFDLAYTCTNNGRSEPKQMDYMATTAPSKWITKAKRAEYDATTSDHWPLSLNLLRRRTEEAKPKRDQKPNRKQIGWELREFSYNDSIRERVGMDTPLDVAEVNLNAHHVYTDGSFTGFRNIHQARWRDRAERREQVAKPTVNNAKAGWAAFFFSLMATLQTRTPSTCLNL